MRYHSTGQAPQGRDNPPDVTVHSFVFSAVSSGLNAWALKSKAALLVALLIKRQGATLWDAALPRLASLSQQGAPQAEAVRLQFFATRLQSYRG